MSSLKFLIVLAALGQVHAKQVVNLVVTHGTVVAMDQQRRVIKMAL